MHGYIRLCFARGQTRKEMAEWLSVPLRTMDYNCKKYNDGEHRCQGYSDCMKPEILEIEVKSPPPEQGVEGDSQ